MIKRTDREHVLQTLSDNPQWNVIDLGCGANAGCEYANVLVDHDDHTDKYPNKKFVKHELNSYPYPFEDKEFDYCFASHILEHIHEPVKFLNEIVRISKRGYIEVPSPLFDNLISSFDGDPFGHKWWISFSDAKYTIQFRPRRHVSYNTVEIPECNKLYPFFRKSMVVELYWEDSISAELCDETYSYENKTYDLSSESIKPWVIGESALTKLGIKFN